MKITQRHYLLLFVIALLPSSAAFAADAPPIDSGATAWMLTSAALVLLMIPGLAMFYGGWCEPKMYWAP